MTKKPIVYVIEPEGPEEWYHPLEEITDVKFIYPDENFSKEDLRGTIDHSEGLIITSRRAISKEDFSFLKKLKIVAKCGAKPSNVDIEEATRRGVAVSYVPGGNNTSVAEYAVMLILASLRQFITHSQAIQNNVWRASNSFLGLELRDKIVGVIGYGAVGKEVVRKLYGFDCKVIVYDPFTKVEKNQCSYLSQVDDLPSLLKESDVISINCLLTKDTENLISDDEFNLMRKTAIIVNTSRGAIIDEVALIKALKEKTIAGAALDVYSKEPVDSQHPLNNIPNVIMTPHVAAWTVETLFREVSGAVNSTLACLKGETIPGLLNPDFLKFKV